MAKEACIEKRWLATLWKRSPNAGCFPPPHCDSNFVIYFLPRTKNLPVLSKHIDFSNTDFVAHLELLWLSWLPQCSPKGGNRAFVRPTHRKQGERTEPSCGWDGKAPEGPCMPSTAHPTWQSPRLLPQRRTKPEPRGSRACCCLTRCRPDRSRLTLAKLKGTPREQTGSSTPPGMCAGAYLFHHTTVPEDSQENLTQTDRWLQLSIPSHTVSTNRASRSSPGGGQTPPHGELSDITCACPWPG